MSDESSEPTTVVFSTSTKPSTGPSPPWYSYITIDMVEYLMRTSIFHPFICWMVPLCFKAIGLAHQDPKFIGSAIWASLMTVRFIASVFNQRIAYGLPRDLDWEEEVVVITGGASGIGLLLAETFGMRGASVAVLDVKEVENADERGITEYKCDVGNREEVQKVAKAIEKDLGPPTILINNAGIVNGKPLLQLTPSDLTRNFSTNLFAHYNTLQTFLPGMLDSPMGGTIVTVSSVMGYLGASHLSDYAAAKAGTIALHNSLQAELQQSQHEGAKFIKTILVTPGQVATPMFKGVETPSHFFAPVVAPVDLVNAIVKMIDSGEGGTVAMPVYAWWIQVMNCLPVGVQKILRDWSGIDVAMAKAKAPKEVGKKD